MPGLVLLGAQWGDEGKGKVTDYLSDQADVVVRYQGGNNAGHTVVVDGQEFKLRLIPSGIIGSCQTCVIGNGVVVDLNVLTKELEYLKERHIDTSRLRLSDRAHLIMPYHIRQDELEEAAKGEAKIGTTKNGIGPCYMDKCARIGLRMGDLLDETYFRERLDAALKVKNHQLEKLYGAEPFHADAIADHILGLAAGIRHLICDTSLLLDEAFKADKKVVFEGAQGTLLDLDHGTYPFVTSSNPTAGEASVGAGVAPSRIDHVLGIVKAYTTRVGAGPFPTEQENDVGRHLQERGHEFGTVTGRTRRCGWLDLPLLRYSIRLSGMDRLALMKLDVLDELSEIKVCTGYKLHGEPIAYFPGNLAELEAVEPVYEVLLGWQTSTAGITAFADLPKEAQAYIRFIEKALDVPVYMVAVGPGREETIILDALF